MSGRTHSWAIAAPVLLALAFAQSLTGAFVWDDAPLIEHNPAMTSARGFVPIVTRDLWGQATGLPSQLYHPLPMLSIWLQTRVFGMHMLPLRLANIAIHALVVWLFARISAAINTGTCRHERRRTASSWQEQDVAAHRAPCPASSS